VRRVLGLFVVLVAGSPTWAQEMACPVVASVVAPDPSSLPGPLEIGGNWSRQSWDGLYGGEIFHGVRVRSLRAAAVVDGNALNAPVEGLQFGAFLARDKRDFIPIESVEAERGPRRIVFVVENGKPIRLSARQVEAAAVEEVLSGARPQDSFALLTAGGPRVALPFGSSKDAIQAAVDALARANLKVREGSAVLDSIIEATTWFGSPQVGDSIFLLARSPAFENSRLDSPVHSALTSRRIRRHDLWMRRELRVEPLHWVGRRERRRLGAGIPSAAQGSGETR